MKVDPLPNERIEAIKQEIKNEITVELAPQSPKRSKTGVGFPSRKAPSESSQNGIDSADDLE